jgi:hypothetical protein
VNRHVVNFNDGDAGPLAQERQPTAHRAVSVAFCAKLSSRALPRLRHINALPVWAREAVRHRMIAALAIFFAAEQKERK